MIVVTGATGQLGRAIVENLLAFTPANQVAVSVRDPKKAENLEKVGVRVRQGDFNNFESIRHSLSGATQILLVSSNARGSAGDPLTQHRLVIEVAKTIGVRRIIYTSQIASHRSSAFPPARDHAATEEMLRQSGLAWTALRNGFYAASGIMLMGDVSNSGIIESPADGKVSWTAHADLAEAAAIILKNEGQYEGPTPPLTGSQGLDLSDLATITSEVLKKTISRKIITDEELKTKMIALKIPDQAIEIALGLYAASRNGEFSCVDPTLEKLLCRTPATMAEVIQTKLTAQI